MKSKTLTVTTTHSSYPIIIGSDLLSECRSLFTLPGKQVLIVSNTIVAPLYLSYFENLGDDVEVQTLILPDGEREKNLETLSRIFDALMKHQYRRNACLVALGGGVVGDMTGFAAACYQRGIDFIQVPTTLLAQVDASVGGKTAVNHPLGKNMIGAFHQPRMVLIDVDTLKTLPDREYFAGLAEVIKTSLLYSPKLFEFLENNVAEIQSRDRAALATIIETCCTHKAEVVAQDEKEQGIRALLNLGHTFGHAIESCLGYGTWLHGEAVGLGCLLAAALSEELLGLDPLLVQRLSRMLEAYHLPAHLPSSASVDTLMQAMTRDKKNIDEALRLILVKELGQGVILQVTDKQQIIAVLKKYQSSTG